MDEVVVLLHGIFRTSWSMRGLEKFLKKSGYATLNIGYKSTKYSIEQIIDAIHLHVRPFLEEHSGKVHFVGYSMGGLVARAYIHKYRPQHLGRVVMLGTPNQGSEVADKVASWKFYKWSYGPAGQQLITDQTSFKHIFGAVDYETGILAGNRTIDPIASWIIGKPNDGKVSIDSTKLDGMSDHAVLSVSHTFFPHDRKAWHAVLKFLKDGKFNELKPSL